MKKIITFLFALLMITSLLVTVFADNDAFVSSPSAVKAPELVDYENEDEDCTAVLVICAYADRSNLSEESKATLEEAYAAIVNSEDLSDLTEELDKLAKKLNVDSSVFAVSDLFDISYAGCVTHDEHGVFTITLKPHMLDNFAGLLHYKNSEWVLVEHAEVNEDGIHLTFEEDELSPFAIVVHDGTAEPNSFPWWILILVVIVVCGLTAYTVTRKKNEKKA